MAGIDARIAELLVEAGALSRYDLDEMLASQISLGEERVAGELFELLLANERTCAEAVARKVGNPALVVSESTLDLAALDGVPESIAAQHGLLPVAMDDTTITLVASDVGVGYLFDQIAFAAARRVVVLAGLPPLLQEAVPAAYAARRSGERVIIGAQSTSERPYLSIARPVQQASVLDAEALFGELETELKKSSARLATPLEHLVGPRPGLPASTFAPPPARAEPTSSTATSSGTQAAQPSPSQTPAASPRMLIVEDDDEILRLLARAFAYDGYSIAEARTGADAIAFLRAHRPDVVLLDAMLPGVHGFQICAAMKSSAELRGTPVVMISAVYKGWEHAREIQETHGADAFVEKPFEVHYVRKLVAGLLRRDLARAPASPDVAMAVQAVKTVLDQHVAAGRLAEAMQQAELWLSVDPFDAYGHLAIGDLRSRAGDLVGALGAYECAAVYAPQLFQAQLNLARFYEKLGFVRRARDTYVKAKDAAPDPGTQSRIEQHLSRI